ncbi:hypothetical protein TSTA_059340 [Talaromyces stipitatus ATCC 10500]|uniref:Zn(2)-C6 fungal-type domain-containing protein n=1 Tax=Talaromyces stipitatus (strain ATCC 10500 / CBS 375.48 / QM 6759 / NRRL 1006) TaxID=441959 RepID=B8MQM5_TALSN|nr:uncharacterized protein TSTA_059340 [Talaromyces stipitatus ATCC 10500]EED13448.1 hypothetical protein TSTA_059340 [Talaromyces stipitatus ATCC 10500]
MDCKDMRVNKRQKSALGCLTCKKRKVKCDEQKPQCQRCLSTGRTCDGYPVPSPTRDRRPGLLLAVPVTQHLRTAEDYRAFQNFMSLVPSLANFASTELWNTYILQLSQADAAIQHIVLSVGHLVGTTSGEIALKEQQEKLICYHYSKALHALTNDPNPDVYIVLLSCLLFCLFEELQGNCYPAIQHIVAGRDIIFKHIRSYRSSASRSDNLVSIKASSTWNPLLAQLLQVYSRLEMHVAVLEARALNPIARLPLSGFSEREIECYSKVPNRLCWDTHPPLSNNVNDNDVTFPEFANMVDASRYLAGLAAICVANLPANPSNETRPRWRSTFLRPSRQALLLDHWLEAFNAMMSTYTASKITIHDRVHCHILRLYQSCLAFMNKANETGQERIFDENKVIFDLNMFRMTILKSVAQEELISPLFFVATRCRIGYVRCTAVEYLRRCGLEGEFLADVAERIIQVEESNHSEEDETTSFGFPAETSRLRLHGLQPAIGQDQQEMFRLMVSSFPYHPHAPIWPLTVHLPLVQERGFMVKAGACLERALRFEMYPSVS